MTAAHARSSASCVRPRHRAAASRAPLQALVLAALCTLSLWAAFRGAALLACTGVSASVRWASAQTGAQPITPQQIREALARLRKNWETSSGQSQGATGKQTDFSSAALAGTRAYSAQTEVPPTVAFWRETHNEVISTNRTASAAVLAVLGDASLCYPAQMLCGTLPPADDSFGCAVSEQLAWLLWGSTDVVGLPLRIGNSNAQERRVRGVFRGAHPFLICVERESDGALGHGSSPLSSDSTKADSPASTSPTARKQNDEAAQGFYALEIRGLPTGDRRAALQTLLQAANLPAPLQISWTGTRASLAHALCLIPCAAAALCLLADMFRLLWRRFARHRNLLLFTAALACSLLLPFVFAHIPAWLIPARWSDGSFWSALWRTLAQEAENALAFVPFSADVPARRALLQAVGGSTLALWCGYKLRTLWARRIGGKLFPLF